MSDYGSRPQWGEVLQQPNIGMYTGGADTARQLWMQRQTEMSAAQQAALAQLTQALTAGRDKTMADQAAKDAAALAARGGGGGGGRKSGGGGGGPTGMMVPAPDTAQPPWVDQYVAQMPTDAAPSYNPNVNWWNVTGQQAWHVPSTPVVNTPHPAPTPVAGTGINAYGSHAYSVAHPMGVGIMPKPVIQLEPTTATVYAPPRLS
jgi:hypothetical protein